MDLIAAPWMVSLARNFSEIAGAMVKHEIRHFGHFERRKGGTEG